MVGATAQILCFHGRLVASFTLSYRYRISNCVASMVSNIPCVSRMGYNEAFTGSSIIFRHCSSGMLAGRWDMSTCIVSALGGCDLTGSFLDRISGLTGSVRLAAMLSRCNTPALGSTMSSVGCAECVGIPSASGGGCGSICRLCAHAIAGTKASRAMKFRNLIVPKLHAWQHSLLPK